MSHPPGYPQRRVLDLTAPVDPAAAPVAGPVPAPSGVTDADRERLEGELTVDRRAERRLLLWEALALLAVAAIIVVRALWLL